MKKKGKEKGKQTAKEGTKTTATILMRCMWTLIAGWLEYLERTWAIPPLICLMGFQTFLPKFPVSINFFTLSHVSSTSDTVIADHET